MSGMASSRPVILSNPRFGRLWVSQLQSDIGTWLLVLAVPVYVFRLTGSPLSTGIAFFAEVAPALVLAPFAGLVADRLDRRLVMVAADAARAASVACMLLAGSAGMVWVIYAALFAESSLGQFFNPAYSAIVPAITGSGADLDSANSWTTVSSGVVRLVGGPLGGLLYGLAGFGWLVIADCATYALSAALIASLPALAIETDAADRARGVRAELLAGIAFCGRDAVLRGMLMVSALFLFANAALTVVLVPFVLRVLHSGPAQFGLLLAALGAGFLAGGYLGKNLSARGMLRAGTAWCLAGVTLAFAGLFNSHELPSALACIGLVGAFGGAILLLIRVQVQRRSPEQIRGRVSAAFGTVQTACTLAGGLAGGALASAIGVVPMADAALVPSAVAALLALALIPGRGPGGQVRPAAHPRSARPWRSRLRRAP